MSADNNEWLDRGGPDGMTPVLPDDLPVLEWRGSQWRIVRVDEQVKSKVWLQVERAHDV